MPGSGRFTTIDAYAGNSIHPLSFHKYAYANGDLVRNSDPSGLFGVASVGVAGAIAGTLSGLQVQFGQSVLDSLGVQGASLDLSGAQLGMAWQRLPFGIKDQINNAFNAINWTQAAHSRKDSTQARLKKVPYQPSATIFECPSLRFSNAINMCRKAPLP